MQEDLFDRVHMALGGKDKAYKTISNCPFCDDSNSHFAYSQAGWYKCVRCQVHGSIYQLAQHLHLIDASTYTPPPVTERPRPTPAPIARWRLNPDRLLEGYRSHPQRYQRWAGYKPVSRQAIERFDLGVGRLPFQHEDGSWYMSRSEWLTVPLYEGDELVAIRGRNLGKSSGKLKWISATGSTPTLFNVANVRQGGVCWLLENIVDAIWLMDTYPDWDAVSTGGVSWRSQWAEWLAACRPEVVIVALDNDLVGNATGDFRRLLERRWRQDRGTEPPAANGPKIANSLRQLGQQAIMFKWPEWAEEKADIGWVLERERKVAA